MQTRGKWIIAGPDPKSTNPNTGQWGIEADSGAWVASQLTYADASYIIALHNNSADCCWIDQPCEQHRK